MTTTPMTTESEEPPFWQVPTVRSDGRMLSGVSGALAEEVGVDVLWVRITWVALFAVGGWGALLYVIVWGALSWTEYNGLSAHAPATTKGRTPTFAQPRFRNACRRSSRGLRQYGRATSKCFVASGSHGSWCLDVMESTWSGSHQSLGWPIPYGAGHWRADHCCLWCQPFGISCLWAELGGRNLVLGDLPRGCRCGGNVSLVVAVCADP